MSNLKVTMVQSVLHWRNPAANRDMFAEKLHTLVGQTNLVVLPEMFSTGFTMAARDNAESMDGPTVAWMSQQAERIGAVVAGSLIIEEAGHYFNRLVWMRPDGSFEHYDKRHLFRMADEHLHYTAGERRVIVELLGWRVLLQVCYDLRFPVWSRNRNDYDLALYVANWPERRAHHWRTLALARAIENLAYVVVVNRVGEDGNAIAYSGDSMAIDPQGRALAHLAYAESIQTLSLEKELMTAYRHRFPADHDADGFVLD